MRNEVKTKTSRLFPVYLNQTAIDKISIFPNTEMYAYFLERLEAAKVKYNFKILAYSLTPSSISLLIVPRNENVEIIARSLFTSIAKKFRNTTGGVGYVFRKRFVSRFLPELADIEKIKEEMTSNMKNELGKEAKKWLFYAFDVKSDRFRVCGNATTEKLHHDMERQFYFKNNRPTILWYLSVIDEIQGLFGHLASSTKTKDNIDSKRDERT